jgi:hypothetical protein
MSEPASFATTCEQIAAADGAWCSGDNRSCASVGAGLVGLAGRVPKRFARPSGRAEL